MTRLDGLFTLSLVDKKMYIFFFCQRLLLIARGIESGHSLIPVLVAWVEEEGKKTS
jgi:hypothetical protein